MYAVVDIYTKILHILYCVNYIVDVCESLTNPTQCDTENQHKDTDWTVQIFTDRYILVCKFFVAAKVDLFFHIVLAIYPKEHDTGETCTKRADVDGQDIHPVGYDSLNTDGHNHADDTNEKPGELAV